MHAMLGSCFGPLMVHNISGEQVQSAEMLLSHCFGKWVGIVGSLCNSHSHEPVNHSGSTWLLRSHVSVKPEFDPAQE